LTKTRGQNLERNVFPESLCSRTTFKKIPLNEFSSIRGIICLEFKKIKPGVIIRQIKKVISIGLLFYTKYGRNKFFELQNLPGALLLTFVHKYIVSAAQPDRMRNRKIVFCSLETQSS